MAVHRTGCVDKPMFLKNWHMLFSRRKLLRVFLSPTSAEFFHTSFESCNHAEASHLILYKQFFFCTSLQNKLTPFVNKLVKHTFKSTWCSHNFFSPLQQVPEFPYLYIPTTKSVLLFSCGLQWWDCGSWFPGFLWNIHLVNAEWEAAGCKDPQCWEGLNLTLSGVWW